MVYRLCLVFKIDHIDRNLLMALHQNAKSTDKALSERVGLSQPSCAERIKRLVERGVMKKFSIQLSPQGHRLSHLRHRAGAPLSRGGRAGRAGDPARSCNATRSWERTRSSAACNRLPPLGGPASGTSSPSPRP
ncbi:AsnC family transcriptional regulator [Paracidovorax avenae]|uniref:AsnC family transcriptional regulator n=1 Tax=Paracidovorax avenae TaxID=80867 RepID=UPI00227762DD|nr:AsnC family transcriptional regulator [Paracidovorax avenae]